MSPRVIVVLFALVCAACPQRVNTPEDVPPTSLVEARPVAYDRLREPLQTSPRNGDLVVTPDTLELRIRRGDGSVAFATIPRGRLVMGCYKKAPLEMSPDARKQTDWWIFSNAEQAVGLELAEKNPWLWFWDAERSCRVRVRMFEDNVHRLTVPEQYYGADDVQLGYRWRQTALIGEGEGVRDDGAVENDVIAGLPGMEQLVLGDGAIALLRADGRALFQRDLTGGKPIECANTQLSVFGGPDGEIYLVATFETFLRGACDRDERFTRLRSEVAEWDADVERFRSTFVLDETRRYDEDEEDPESWGWTEGVERRLEVAGGTLSYDYDLAIDMERVESEVCIDLDRGTGTCLQTDPCLKTAQKVRRRAAYRFETVEGVKIDLGGATFSADRKNDGCK